MLSIVLSIIIIVLQYCLIFTLLFFLILVGVRFWLEPVKGVCKCKTKLHGKVALITGGNSGIGLETAKNLARRGARVIIASRNKNKSEDAVALIKETTGNDNIEYRVLNLADKTNIQKFAKKFNEDFDRLDILVNNAGCGTVKKCTTEEGVDLLMQINYVGPFTLTNLLLDKIIASKPSRIVNVSSLVHLLAKLCTEDLSNCHKSSIVMRYSKTKLCDILWTKELARRLPKGVTANVLHPGLVKTNIFDNVLNSSMKKFLFFIIDLLFKTPLEGAQTIIHLCVSPELENSTGGYYMDCKQIKPSRTAQDEVLAEILWNKTLMFSKH